MSRPRSALGFDFGMRRIGVAYGLPPAAPRALCVLKAEGGVPDWNRIARLVEQWRPDCMVVGMPYNMDGSDGELLEPARRFGRRLEGRFELPVHGIDERLSTRAAMDSNNRKPGEDIDDIAAKIILETWFNEQQSRRENLQESQQENLQKSRTKDGATT